MAFVAQTTPGKFVAWGKEKENAENPSYIVKKGDNITGIVTKLKDSETYGKILEMKIKEEEEPLVVMGTTILNRELGYEWNEKRDKMIEIPGMKPVVIGDTIRITFNGMLKVKGGREAYDLIVEVDR